MSDGDQSLLEYWYIGQSPFTGAYFKTQLPVMSLEEARLRWPFLHLQEGPLSYRDVMTTFDDLHSDAMAQADAHLAPLWGNDFDEPGDDYFASPPYDDLDDMEF
jgi:hypothetical protein